MFIKLVISKIYKSPFPLIFMDKKMKVLVTLGILIAIGVSFYLVSYAITRYTGYTITGKAVYSKEEQVQIAKCLTEKGVVLYCSTLSFNCMRQRSSLGEAFEYINYLDCNENPEECQELSLPAWRIGGRFYYGIRDLGKLSESVGCEVK